SVRFFSSAVSPDQDSAMITSLLAIMPRSPWLASPGWTKSAGVPVEEKVEAILRPTWPDLPMPVTITRPCAARIRSIAAAKLEPRPLRSAVASASMPPPSASSVRKAESMAACARSLVMSAGLGLAMRRFRSLVIRGIDSTEQAARQAWQGQKLTPPLCELAAIRKHIAHCRQHGLDCDIGGATVADRVVALDARAFSRGVVTGRLENGGNRVERFPMPWTGRPEDRDRRRPDRGGYMHQSGIVGD